jgi:hypothetical protein
MQMLPKRELIDSSDENGGTLLDIMWLIGI